MSEEIRKLQQWLAECGYEQIGDAGPIREALADADGLRWGEGRPESEGREGRPAPVVGGSSLADAMRDGREIGIQPGRVRAPTKDGSKATTPGCGEVGNPDCVCGERKFLPGQQGQAGSSARRWWSTEPNVGRVAHGVAFRVDRLRLCGNGVVPDQSIPAWAIIKTIAAEEAAQDLAVERRP